MVALFSSTSTHRPLTLRLLHEAATAESTRWTDTTLAEVFGAVAIWTTRTWLTVEHVLPQKLTDGWKQALGDDAERIHGWYGGNEYMSI